jgi:hypothetical protein
VSRKVRAVQNNVNTPMLMALMARVTRIAAWVAMTVKTERNSCG